jgi:hypothetical protein
MNECYDIANCRSHSNLAYTELSSWTVCTRLARYGAHTILLLLAVLMQYHSHVYGITVPRSRVPVNGPFDMYR